MFTKTLTNFYKQIPKFIINFITAIIVSKYIYTNLTYLFFLANLTFFESQFFLFIINYYRFFDLCQQLIMKVNLNSIEKYKLSFYIISIFVATMYASAKFNLIERLLR